MGGAQCRHGLSDVTRRLGLGDCTSNKPGNLSHIGLGHALRRDRGGTYPNTGSHRRRSRIVGNCVLIQRDARRVTTRLGIGPRNTYTLQSMSAK